MRSHTELRHFWSGFINRYSQNDLLLKWYKLILTHQNLWNSVRNYINQVFGRSTRQNWSQINCQIQLNMNNQLIACVLVLQSFTVCLANVADSVNANSKEMQAINSIFHSNKPWVFPFSTKIISLILLFRPRPLRTLSEVLNADRGPTRWELSGHNQGLTYTV